MLFDGVVKSCCAQLVLHGVDTYRELCRVLAWTMTACLRNVFPIPDWNLKPWGVSQVYPREVAGKPINPFGKYLAVLGLTADLEELCNEFKLNHWTSLSPCYNCPATVDGELSWTDIRDDSPCFAASHKPPPDGEIAPPPKDHTIWLIPGLTLFCVLWDIMHGLDLGVTGLFEASVLVDMITDPRLGRNQEQRLQKCWEIITSCYDTLGIKSKFGAVEK